MRSTERGKPRVLLAGATGTLGRRLAPALHRQGFAVRALARKSSRERLVEIDEYLEDSVTAEVTESATLGGVCHGIDIVLSTIGITRQRDDLTFDDVDYGANCNLLAESETAGVDRFVYISVTGVDQPNRVPALKAKLRFEQELQASSLDALIFRPSGFFTDVVEILEMARREKVNLFGTGTAATSPIDPSDLAEVVASGLEGSPGIVEVGGPEDWTWNGMAELCFRLLERPPNISHWPVWTLKATLVGLRFLSPQSHGTLSFLGYVMTHDSTAPHRGTHTLGEFLEAEVAAQRLSAGSSNQPGG